MSSTSPYYLTDCEHATFFGGGYTTSQLCQIARESSICKQNYSFVNFYAMTYCDLNGSTVGFIFLMILFIFFIFRFIGAVVEEYLAPAIAYTTEYLHLSEAMGAVTLLALANGAGDVVTAIVASTTPQGISYNIGSLYGAGLFVTTLVVGFTILGAGEKGVQLEPASIWRDVGFYIIATLIIITFGAIGNLNLVSGFVLLACYVVLVLVVFVQEKFFAKKSEEHEHEGASIALIPSSNVQRVDEHDLRQGEEKPRGINNVNKLKHAVRQVQVANLVKKINNLCLLKLERVRERKKIQEEKNEGFMELTLSDKFFFVVDLPFNYLRKVTIPPAEEEEYNKIWATICITPGLILMSWILTLGWGWYQLYALVPIGLALSAGIWFTSPEKGVPKMYILIQTFAIISALLWTYLVSGILIDLLNTFGMITNLSKTYLGLTVIAVGNALPDAVTTIALSKQGLAIMGMTGAFAGQLFGLLVGLGLALITLNTNPDYSTLYPDGKDFQLFDKADLGDNLIEIIVLFTILGTLTVTFTFGLLRKYVFDRTLAYVLIICYCVFFVTATIIAIYDAFNGIGE